MKADLIVSGSRVREPSGVRGDAVAVRGGRILAVGRRDQLRSWAGHGTRWLHVDGATWVPGFIDSHLHLLSFGFSLGRLDLGGCQSIEELTSRVARAAQQRPEGTWILGGGWDQDSFREKRYPTREDLDAAAPRHPVLLRRACGHVAVANSLALRMAEVTAQTADPPGGAIDRHPDGEPTGVLRERAIELVTGKIPPPEFEELCFALRRAVRFAWSVGVTSVHTEDVRAAGGLDPLLRAYERVLREEEMPLGVYLDIFWQAFGELRERGLRTGDGDDLLRIGAVKLFADGSLGAATAALSEPYADEPGNTGILVMQPDELERAVSDCHLAGMQVAIHAIGDRAIELGLRAIGRALQQHPRQDARHRLIHCQVMRQDLVEGFLRYGVVADIQPKFVGTDQRWAEARLGKERLRWAYAWRSMWEAGLKLAGGSDCPVEPLNPAYGLHAAVTRCDLSGQPEGGWQPQQRLSAEQALHLFTAGAAYASFEERKRGTIQPGAIADLVALDGDPVTVEPDRLKDLRVLATVAQGRVVYLP